MPITTSVNVHEEGVTAAVIIRETPRGMDASVKGYLSPIKLVYFLREIADHIEQNGPVDG